MSATWQPSYGTNAAAGRLGQTEEQEAAARRIAVNPARREILDDKGVPGLIDRVRNSP